MEKVYKILNYYLNEICKYLEKENLFLLNNIRAISIYNDTFYEYIKNLEIEQEVVTNHLTYDDVFMIAREIIEQIDPNYLEEFDKLLSMGKLDFSYNNNYNESACIFYQNGIPTDKIININRAFNYEDVWLLIHEFMHYINGDKNTLNRYYLTEFISIYFELYAVQYLLDKGIPYNEIDVFKRFKWIKEDCVRFYQYDTVLLAYIYFGDINDDTINYLQKYVINISKKAFDHECLQLYDCLNNIYKYNQEEIKNNINSLGAILSEEFITKDYRYILGTILAIYALKYVNFKDMVYLNNHINEYNDKSILDICLSIGINLRDENFLDNLKLAIDEFVNNIVNNKVKKK